MKITTGQAYTLYFGLKEIDKQLETLPNETVLLNIAINIDRLQSLAEAYERTQARVQADLSAASAKTVPAEVGETPAQRHARETKLNLDNSDAIAKMRAEPQEIELKTFNKVDLNLGANPKVRATALAQIMPILEGLT